MPMKSDGKGRRYAELVFDMPGAPDQVWRAIATGPGITAWFVPTTVEEREGGAVSFDLGGGNISQGQVTAYEPPRRFAIEEPDWNPEAPPLATEFLVETTDGGQCRVRVVMSLATEDERWDGEIGGMESGWAPFFEVMRIYLRDFAGQKAASLRPLAIFPGSLEEAWSRFAGELGVAGAKAGDRIESKAGAPTLAGRVERVGSTEHQTELLVRLEQPTGGVALPGAWSWAGQTHLGVSLFFYGDDCEAVAERERAAWDAWLAKVFQASAEEPAGAA